jgi:tripartite-type tricarboxylate transporter receptor subunit TctC
MRQYKSRFSVMFAMGIVASTGLCPPLHAAQSEAKDYPSKPVRFIVPFAPGGGSDITGRAIAGKLQEKWGHQFVVDNRAGAAGTIGVEMTARSTPDGYTICLISASHAIKSASPTSLPYSLEKDLQGVSQATSLYYVLTVTPALPVRTVKELIAYAKANPGQLNYGSAGTGGLQHLAGELFAQMSGTSLVHIPYKGGNLMITAALSGETQISISTVASLGPQMKSGRLRMLAITARERSPLVPELPTVAESGLPGYAVYQWYGVIAGSRVDREIISKLSRAIAEAVHAPDVVKRLAADGSIPVGSTPDEFTKYVKSEIALWRKLITGAKLELQ